MPLTGTADSLSALRNCVETAVELIAANPETVPTEAPREVPGITLEGLANILTAAGIQDLRFLASDRIPVNDMRLRFVWRTGAVLGGLHQSPRGQRVEIGSFARAYLDVFEAFCPNRFEPEFEDVEVIGETYGFMHASLICATADAENYVAFFFALDDNNYSAFFHQVQLPLGDEARDASEAVGRVIRELAASAAAASGTETGEGETAIDDGAAGDGDAGDGSADGAEDAAEGN